MPKLFLQRNNSELADAIHGEGGYYNYHVGAGCGRKHEFMTKNCSPILFTKDEMEKWQGETEFVEVTSWNTERIAGGNDVYHPGHPESGILG